MLDPLPSRSCRRRWPAGRRPPRWRPRSARRRARLPRRGLQDARSRSRRHRGSARADRRSVRGQRLLPAGRARRPRRLGAYAERWRRSSRPPAWRPARRAPTTTATRPSWRSLLADPVPIVSFTFGCPPPSRRRAARRRQRGLAHRHRAEEAAQAAAAGADALVLQGIEAGGHRGSFHDAEPTAICAARLLRSCARGPTCRSSPRAGSPPGGRRRRARRGRRGGPARHRVHALPRGGDRAGLPRGARRGGPDGLTRAFTGRTARGIVNRFLAEPRGRAARLPGSTT